MGNTASSEVNREPLGIRVICISDTHGRHRDCKIPDGDILVHAGDFTRYGKRTDANDFNKWLGELPHRHKIVVNGNHECNAPWKKQTAEILTAAHFLNDSGIELFVDANGNTASQNDSASDPPVDLSGDTSSSNSAPAPSGVGTQTLPPCPEPTSDAGIATAATPTTLDVADALCTEKAASTGVKKSTIKVKIWGTNFFWPMKDGNRNPHFDMIPDCDILVAHGPVKGIVDGGSGCPALRERVEELIRDHAGNPRLVVSGHIHAAHGVAKGPGAVTFVNAAMAQRGHGHMGWPAVVLDL